MKRKTLGVAILAAVLLFAGALPASAATQNWSTPVNVTPFSPNLSAPQITTTPDGTLTAVWSRSDGINHIIQAASSTDHGATWSAPVDLSTTSLDATSPQITTAPDGTLTAIWTRYNGSDYIIQATSSTDHGTTWSAPVDLSAPGQDAIYPQITVAPDNSLTAIWYRWNGSNNIVQAASSIDHGATWTSPVDLSTAGQNASPPPRITTAPDGTLTAIWTRYNGSNNIIQTTSSTNHGTTWSAPVDLSATGQDALYPQITVAPDNSLTAIWYRWNGSNNIIQAASSTNHGATWSAPVDLSATGQDASSPQITTAPDGTLAALWTRSNGTNNLVQSASSTDHGATWTTPANLSATGHDALGAQISVAPDNSLTATWYRSDGSNNIVQATSSTNHGATWTTPANLSATGQNASDPQITVATDSSLTAIWTRYDGTNSVIQASYTQTTPVITSAVPPTPVIGTPYSFQVSSIGTPAPTFALSSGSLPPGLTLSPTGLISGTPTTAGNYTFTITASNAVAPDATATYTLSLASLTLAPVPGTHTSEATELANSGVNALPLGVAALAPLVLGLASLIVTRTRRTSHDS